VHPASNKEALKKGTLKRQKKAYGWYHFAKKEIHKKERVRRLGGKGGRGLGGGEKGYLTAKFTARLKLLN